MKRPVAGRLALVTMLAATVGAPIVVGPSVAAPSVAAPSVLAPGASLTTTPPPAAVSPVASPDPGVSSDPAASLGPPSGEGTALLPDPSADHTIGDRIVLSDFFDEEQAAFTVVEAIQRPQSDVSGGPEYAFLVEIESLASSIHYNVVQFSIFDDESFEYPAESGLQQPELNFGDLPKGRTVKGWLTFAGPDSSEYLELQWVPIESDEPAFVRVRLP
ncbi:MAG: hypothetical protein M3472_08570 [Chloroflexota bacterium]|nr:hypothetical protein [Chloroflexota bacterium]